MTTKIQKWGNSLGVRLPKTVIDQLRLREGSEVDIRERDAQIMIAPKMHRKASWNDYVIEMIKEPEAVSENIDTIIYGASR
jgi:antitoxin MazE